MIQGHWYHYLTNHGLLIFLEKKTNVDYGWHKLDNYIWFSNCLHSHTFLSFLPFLSMNLSFSNKFNFPCFSVSSPLSILEPSTISTTSNSISFNHYHSYRHCKLWWSCFIMRRNYEWEVTMISTWLLMTTRNRRFKNNFADFWIIWLKNYYEKYLAVTCGHFLMGVIVNKLMYRLLLRLNYSIKWEVLREEYHFIEAQGDCNSKCTQPCSL